MNWMKVKIILIIFFLSINALLAGILVTKNLEGTPDAERISQDVHQILLERGITVEPSMIDTFYGLVQAADAYPISSEESVFLKELTENAETDGDGNFIYNGSVIGIFDNLVHFECTDIRYKDAQEYFASVGLDFKESFPVSVEGTETDGTFTYGESCDGLEIFGAKAVVRKAGGYVVSADAVWYEIEKNPSKSTKTISIADALLSFAADKGRGNQPCTVSDISYGFSVDAGVESASVSQMIPCIRVTTGIGSAFYYDARSPEQ